MSTWNTVNGLVNLTRDPELSYTPKGTAVCKLGFATNYERKSDGTTYEEVWYGSGDAFGATAETIAKYFKKGDPIFLEGRLKTDRWNDKTTGAPQSATKVVVTGFHFLPRGRSQAATAAAPAPAAPRPAAVAEPGKPVAEDDVPF